MAFLLGLFISVLYILSVLFSKYAVGTYYRTLEYVEPTLLDVFLTLIPIFNLVFGIVLIFPKFKPNDFSSRYFKQKD
jgi:hypothetical protein